MVCGLITIPANREIVMAEFSWSDLCGDSEDDDEDYDPFKDPTKPAALDDSDSDSVAFDSLRHLLSPKKPRGKGAARAGESTGASSAQALPVAQAHWHTRQQGKMPDDVWTRTDSLLEQAEMTLDPMSPGAMSDTYQNEMLINCTHPEYLRLLAVARGEREPEEDEDDEDADFVPEDDDGEGAGENNEDEPGARLSVSSAELSALIADNRSSKSSAGAPARPAQSAPAVNSPSRRARADATESGKGKEAAEEEGVKPVRVRRGRRDKKKKPDADSVVRVLPFSEVGGLMQFPGSNAGFSRDQCVQLQVYMYVLTHMHTHTHKHTHTHAFVHAHTSFHLMLT